MIKTPNIKISSIYRFALVCVAMAVSAATYSQAASSTLVFPRHKSANIGIIVRDLATHKDIICRNPDKLMTPASILKCVTTASVFLADKEADCFTTDVMLTGDITPDSILLGDIVVKAVGDPTVDSRYFPAHYGLTDSIAARIKEMGIKRVAGYIDIDSVGFIEQGPGQKWELEDLKWSYGTGLYPLNFKDNALPGDRAMKDPAAYFTKDLKERLADVGVTIDETDVNFGEIPVRRLYSHSSPTYSQIMREMMEKSNNLFAESMLRVLEPCGTVADALELETKLLYEAGLDCDNFVAFDGSGLTRSNLLTPKFMADLLDTMISGNKSERYISLFPKAGEEGTVKNLLKDTPLAGKLLLKSGSMRGVLCYAGYKVDNDGNPTHAVVIMVNGYTCKSLSLRNAIGDYLTHMFRQG